jgi:hypothetical protein
MNTHFKSNQQPGDMLIGKLLSIFQEVADELNDRGYYFSADHDQVIDGETEKIIIDSVRQYYTIVRLHEDGTFRLVESRANKVWLAAAKRDGL